VLPLARHPDVVAEVFEMQAAFFHESGLDDDLVMEQLDRQVADQSLQQQLSARAAVRAGQSRLVEAFALHMDRARLAPSAALPRLDAARVLRRMAVASQASSDAEKGRTHLAQALRLLARAVELAVSSDDKLTLRRILIERALCLLELGDPRSALRDADQLLARDPTDFEAFSAKLACDRALRQREAAPASAPLAQAPLVEGTPEAEPSDATPALDEEIPALSIERLLPGRAELTESLQGAGRDLQSIYRGLHQLLRDPETDPAADAEPDPDDPAPPSGGAPRAAPPRGE